jgi:hypothetical protein
LIAVYYGLTGFASTWYFRKTLFVSARNFFMRGLFPLLGGLMLVAVFVYGLQQFLQPDWLVSEVDGSNVEILGFGAVGVVGLGILVIGIILMIIWNIMSPDYFKGKTLDKRVHPAND